MIGATFYQKFMERKNPSKQALSIVINSPSLTILIVVSDEEQAEI